VEIFNEQELAQIRKDFTYHEIVRKQGVQDRKVKESNK
jgi:hypothetical protein